MDLLPLFHNLRDRRCVMVGGGEIALRKLRQLIAVGAAIEVIAPEINSSIQKLAHESGLTLVNREFDDADLDGAVLVVAATNDAAVNRRVSKLAQTRNIPVNVVD
ncbi:precorrin-2 dehydrogenase/sirohydrochlorin ferrochelatase family protein, partial [Porticoccus sp.]|uniref:precorrin-2 dehydrogenase/sirohydrochlorin ferrochelatase family protein n=1 Tax=Porticoccus sp. TaxID=2024853 RepID=UPI003F6A3B51